MKKCDKFLKEADLFHNALGGAGLGSAVGGLGHLIKHGNLFKTASNAAGNAAKGLTGGGLLDSMGKGAFYGLLAGLSVNVAKDIVKYFIKNDDEAERKVMGESVEELPDNVVEELKKLGIEDKFYESDVWNEAEVYIKEILDNPEKIEAAGVKPELVIAAFVKVAYNNWLEGKKTLDEATDPSVIGYTIGGGLIGGAAGGIPGILTAVGSAGKYGEAGTALGAGYGALAGSILGLSIGLAKKLVYKFSKEYDDDRAVSESVEELPDNVVEELKKLGIEDKFYESDVWNEAEAYIKEIIDNPEKIEAAGVKPEVVIAAFVKVAYNNWLEGKSNLQESKEVEDDEEEEKKNIEVPIDLSKIKSILAGGTDSDNVEDDDREESPEKLGDNYLNGIKSVKIMLIKRLDDDSKLGSDDEESEHIADGPIIVKDILKKALRQQELEGNEEKSHGCSCLIKRLMNIDRGNIEPHGIPKIIVFKSQLDADE